jgi:uncharacterized protein (TIGR02145 family)
MILFFYLLFPDFLYSQGEWNNWIFGKHAGITFNTIPPAPISNVSPLYNSRGANVSVSDSLGNLVFYTEVNINRSLWIYNRNHNRTPNGNLFSGSDANQPQSFFTVQSLTDDSIYYIFSVLDPYDTLSFGGLVYSVFDMRLDNGFGDVLPGEQSIPIYLGRDAHSVVTGTRHQNNKDAWIIVRKLNTPHYRSYLINSLGIDTIPVTSTSLITTNPNNSGYLSLDNIKISPDGTKLICLADSSAEFCAFNSTTGVISPLFKIFVKPNQIFWYDYAEFSVDNKFLYITEGGQGNGGSRLYQFDATLTDSTQFKQSQVLISSESFFWNQYFSGLQRGPDHKIYVSTKNANFDSISVINNPSVQGLGCNFQKNALWLLNGNFAWRGFPQFLQKYYLYMNHSGQCETDSINFSYITWPPTDSLYWNFGDPASGDSNISHAIHPKHKFSSAGSYNVTLIVRHEDKRFDTVIQSISIKPSPAPDLGPDQTICASDSVTFDAGACAGCTYVWSNITGGLPNIGTNQTYIAKTTALYLVTVTNSFGCIGRDTVYLLVTPAPVVTNNPLSKTICSGESTNIALTSNVSGTTFHWLPSLISGNITGFSADSGTMINQILINNQATAGTVKYSITPKIGNCIGASVEFMVTINPGNPVNISIVASANNICAGTLVTYTATPTNPGINPFYQWKVNGSNTGGNSQTFMYPPTNGDIVNCIMTSSITTCVSNNPSTSNSIIMLVNPLVNVSINISSSSNPFCIGSTVSFIAIVANQGTTPVYQWKVNGINAGSNSPTFAYNPVSGDFVNCVLTSSVACPVVNPVTSNIITMTGNMGLPAAVSIVANPNPFCPGTSVMFTATPNNGGTNPSYQWKINGTNAGSNSPTFSYNPANNDSVRCVMTSNLVCVSGNPATSNEIILLGTLAPMVTFTTCFDTVTTLNAKPIKLKGGIPFNGTYTGPGVAGGIFTSATAGIGTKTITYTYTNASLCSASKTKTITVQANPAFSCGNNLTDIRDGKSYPTVQIDSQCWMASNLNYGTMILSSSHQRDNCINEKYCYNDLSTNCGNQTYYQWDEIMRYDDTPALQGLCPPGWHVPSETEWNLLFSNWSGNGFAGSPLKYSGFSGFNALLSGVKHQNFQWNFLNFATFFWTSTANGPYKAWAHGMNDYDPSVSLYPSLRSNAFSIRCLRD